MWATESRSMSDGSLGEARAQRDGVARCEAKEKHVFGPFRFNGCASGNSAWIACAFDALGCPRHSRPTACGAVGSRRPAAARAGCGRGARRPAHDELKITTAMYSRVTKAEPMSASRQRIHPCRPRRCIRFQTCAILGRPRSEAHGQWRHLQDRPFEVGGLHPDGCVGTRSQSGARERYAAMSPCPPMMSEMTLTAS
jgi:hypothetical protein